MEKKSAKNIFVEGAISPAFIAEKIEQHQSKIGIGAHQIFLGQVRADQINGKLVTGIEYTSYEEMACEKLQQIKDELFNQFPLNCAHVYHSMGWVATGHICLFVFVSSAHRKAATEACALFVERIKAELPIWGKEILEEGDHQWKVNK